MRLFFQLFAVNIFVFAQCSCRYPLLNRIKRAEKHIFLVFLTCLYPIA